MRLCSRCRHRAEGAEVRQGHQTEGHWLCWECLATLADSNRRDGRPFGPCCLDSMEIGASGVSVWCNCPYANGVNVWRCESKACSHSISQSQGCSFAMAESETVGLTRSRASSSGKSRVSGVTSTQTESLIVIDPHGEASESVLKYLLFKKGFMDGDGI